MSYHSALDADLRETGHDDDDGPPFERCDVCGKDSQYAINGDCWNLACVRSAAVDQMDPPTMDAWLAALDTDAMTCERRAQQKIAA